MPNTADYLNQLINDKNDLADNLVTMGVAASHSETFTELVPKVLDISGGGNIGYQVTFKVDGNDYYIASCQQGESITEPPTPTSETGFFSAWQLNGTDVSFPYTPSADAELNAHFVQFEQRDWIKSTGAYIDTDIMTDIDDRYDVEFDLTNTLTRQFCAVCYNGSRATEEYAGVYFLLLGSSTYFNAGIGGQLLSFYTSWSAGTYHITVQNKNVTVTRNGATVDSRSSTGTTQSTYPWRLLNGGDPYLNRYCTFNVKSYKIYDKVTDELKHNIVAGYKNINGVMTGGVMDLVTGTFYQPSDSNFEISST